MELTVTIPQRALVSTVIDGCREVTEWSFVVDFNLLRLRGSDGFGYRRNRGMYLALDGRLSFYIGLIQST